jgi:small subunit ribosomal protein S7
MSRRRRAVKRQIEKDPRYGSTLISQLINMVMQRGKKNLARSIVYGSIEKVSEKLGKGDPVDLLLGALENSRPKVEVKSRRVGGATYQVPVEISYERQHTLVFRWMIGFAKARKGLATDEALAQEIIDAYNNTGSVVKKKDDVQRMAQANRAFAHLRW